MNKLFISTILTIFHIINLYSQDTEKKSDIREVRKNNYQIELGYGSIKSVYNHTAGATIMFKKKYNRGELIDLTSIKFLRAYFTVNSDIKFGNDSITSRSSAFNGSDRTDLTFGFGIEKQFQNRRFVHYVGGDIFANYYSGRQINGLYYLNSIDYSGEYQNRETINAGLTPFFGLKYYISDQFSLGIETGLSLSYYRSKYNNVLYSFDIVNGQEVNSQTEFEPFVENGLRFNFLGVRFITIGYSFK